MTDLEDKNEWKNCIDITGVRLPTGYYFGASAGTGDLSGEWAEQGVKSVLTFPGLLGACDIAGHLLLELPSLVPHMPGFFLLFPSSVSVGTPRAQSCTVLGKLPLSLGGCESGRC